LKINHAHTTSATLKMAHKFKKKLKKIEIFTSSKYGILASTKKIQLKILLFDPPSKVSKTAKEYVNTFETNVCM
jgi:hypothetical protein